MAKFFGTDGIRGVVNQDFDFQLVYNCGNTLGQLFPNAKILIGQDTRKSGDFFVNAFSCGAMDTGVNVTNIGVCATAGICFLTKKLGFDFGVIISASHNPANFNGIKIVDKNGEKICGELEEKIEQHFAKQVHFVNSKIGSFCCKKNYVNLYKNFLLSQAKNNLSNLKIVLDCANGTASKIAPQIFKKLGAKVVAISCKPNGENININCGSTHIENLQKKVLKHKADLGFAFDGDSDRVIAVDEQGNVVDGDKILYLFSTYYLEKKLLTTKKVVGTIMTNYGVEKALNKKGIELIRTSVGDKNINFELNKNNLIFGGESSGHIFNKTKLMTGDGILNALMIANICVEKNKSLSEFFNFEIYNQTSINVDVENKEKIMTNIFLLDEIKKQEKQLAGIGRIVIRPSGTEPIIRIMVETQDENLSNKIANNFFEIIKKINN